MTRTNLMIIVVIATLGYGCSDSSNAPMTSPGFQPSASDYGSESEYSRVPAVGLYPVVSELNTCGLAQEVAARFSGPGYIHGTRVGLYVSFFGMPNGEKRLRVFWDLDNRPGEYETTSASDEDPFDNVIEHEYRDAKIGDTRKVRVELLIAGQTAECARNRTIILENPLPETQAGSSPVTGSTTLCDLGWGVATCGIPGDPTTSYFFDFETVSKVPAGAGNADLSKGHVDCCSWNSQNGTTQVNTGIAAALVSTVTCGPGDGRTYTAAAIPYSQPYATVICLRTGAGRYVRYTGQASCCGEITIDFTAF